MRVPCDEAEGFGGGACVQNFCVVRGGDGPSAAQRAWRDASDSCIRFEAAFVTGASITTCVLIRKWRASDICLFFCLSLISCDQLSKIILSRHWRKTDVAIINEWAWGACTRRMLQCLPAAALTTYLASFLHSRLSPPLRRGKSEIRRRDRIRAQESVIGRTRSGPPTPPKPRQ